MAYLSLDEYEELKTNLSTNGDSYKNDGVQKLARHLFPKVKKFVAADTRLAASELEKRQTEKSVRRSKY